MDLSGVHPRLRVEVHPLSKIFPCTNNVIQTPLMLLGNALTEHLGDSSTHKAAKVAMDKHLESRRGRGKEESKQKDEQSPTRKERVGARGLKITAVPASPESLRDVNGEDAGREDVPAWM